MPLLGSDRKCISVTKTDAEEVKRRSKRKKKRRNGKKKKKRGPAMPRAAREEVRVVKRVLLAPRGRFLLAFLDGGSSVIFRIKSRDASTSVRARIECRKIHRP